MYWAYIGIMEKRMETTIFFGGGLSVQDFGFRVLGLGLMVKGVGFRVSGSRKRWRIKMEKKMVHEMEIGVM